MFADTSMLRDPATHQMLTYIPAAAGQNQGLLYNPATGRKYPVREGIPQFVEATEITGVDRKFQKFYDLFAPVYDAMIKGYILLKKLGNDQTYRMEYLRELEIRDGHKVLEISVGTGSNIRYLPKSCQYAGIDLSWGMLRQAKKNLARWGFRSQLYMGNAEALPFKDNSFDVVFTVGAVKFYKNKTRAIHEMIRVAKPGTKIIIVDPTEETAQFVESNPLSKRFFKGMKEMTLAPIDILPAGMRDVKMHNVSNGSLYCLQFRKPAGATTPVYPDLP
jgi:ubiquinone/menaquinone biosynthesis C-methylase UbiE